MKAHTHRVELNFSSRERQSEALHRVEEVQKTAQVGAARCLGEAESPHGLSSREFLVVESAWLGLSMSLL